MPRQLACLGLLVVLCATYAHSVCDANSAQPQRAFPFLDIGCTHEIRYLGSYHSDGKFRPSGLLDEIATHTAAPHALRPSEVPPNWNLHPREKRVYNLAPSAHAEARAREHSLLTSWRDDIVTLVYGREKALEQPRYVASDSLGRLIVGDPAASAVHVLDGDQSFQIVAGRNQRLRSIAGVATDRDNNIYIGDPEAELVVVFDPYGHWLRDIGRYDDTEGMFHQIVGISIDIEHNRLYVLDGGTDSLLILELGGHLARRLGGRRHEQSVTFDHPIGVTTKAGRVYVADSDGTRIQIFDFIGRPQRSFAIKFPRRPRTHVSLAVDSDQDLFIAAEDENTVRIFDASGEPLAMIGTSGHERGEFSGPAGLWIDNGNQLYVSEVGIRRVQVFAIATPEQKDVQNAEAPHTPPEDVVPKQATR